MAWQVQSWGVISCARETFEVHQNHGILSTQIKVYRYSLDIHQCVHIWRKKNVPRLNLRFHLTVEEKSQRKQTKRRKKKHDWARNQTSVWLCASNPMALHSVGSRFCSFNIRLANDARVKKRNVWACAVYKNDNSARPTGKKSSSDERRVQVSNTTDTS